MLARLLAFSPEDEARIAAAAELRKGRTGVVAGLTAATGGLGGMLLVKQRKQQQQQQQKLQQQREVVASGSGAVIVGGSVGLQEVVEPSA